MAYSNALPEATFNALYDTLTKKASNEHDAAYRSNLAKAKSRLQKLKCAGKYVGSWQRLLNNWLSQKVSNIHVYECLKLGCVIGDADGVEFTSAYQEKKTKR